MDITSVRTNKSRQTCTLNRAQVDEIIRQYLLREFKPDAFDHVKVNTYMFDPGHDTAPVDEILYQVIVEIDHAAAQQDQGVVVLMRAGVTLSREPMDAQ